MTTTAVEVKDSIRLDAWRSVFEKTNRILSERRVTVTMAENVQNELKDVPGWTDGLNINLNADKVREMLKTNDAMSAVLRLKGLNYHELSHVLFTPRMSEDFPRRVVKRAEETGDAVWWYAFNALEDQRIETWFTSTYRASRRYFEATVLEWIIKNGNAEAAVLLYGRKYLDPKIRVQAGRVFVKKYDQALYDEFQQVIDQYITLVLPADTNKAWTLLSRYVELLRKMQGEHNAPLPTLVMNDNGAHGHSHSPGKNDPTVARSGKAAVGDQKKARDKAKAVAKAAGNADKAEQSGQGGGKGADANGSDADGSGQGDNGQAGGKGAGATGTGGDVETDQSMADSMESLVQAARDNMQEVRDDEQLREDVDASLDAVKAAVENGKMNAKGRAAAAATFPAPAEANMAVRKVHNILLRIRQEAEPETLRQQVNGRVDVRRAVTRSPHEVDIFKSWDSGSEEETGVEAVVLIDVSGSMSGRSRESSMATWALKRAFDRLNIRTTVLMFDTDFKVVWQPAEKAHPGQIPMMADHGGTNPTTALLQAQNILAKSNEPNKVIITVTDGSWSGNEDTYTRIMRNMRRAGVVSMLLGLDGALHYGKHGHDEGHALEKIQDLPKAAVKLVARLMRQHVNA